MAEKQGSQSILDKIDKAFGIYLSVPNENIFMKVCLKCGQEASEKDKCCRECGAKLGTSDQRESREGKIRIEKRDCPICGGKGRIKGRSLLDQNVKCPVCDSGINKFELSEEEKLVKCTNCRDGWVKAASINVQKEFCDTCKGRGWIVR